MAKGTRLPNLSSDWYWEQDADLRFTRVEVRSGDLVEQALADRILGRKRWETGIEIEGGWDEHRALVEARGSFRDVLMWRELDDGNRRYVLTSGEPVFDAKGAFTGYRGIGRDVTAQKRVERLLRLEHRITRRLAENAPPQEALGRALQALCETEGWERAEIWQVDEGGNRLRRHAHWSGAAVDAPKPFVAVPISTAGRVTAVLEVTSRRVRAPHKRVQQALQVIASMIGQYLERMAAEQAVRESE